MSFYLVKLTPDGEVSLPDYGPYEAGPEAAKQAKALTEQLGVKVQPRRMRQAPNWKERQARRLADGTLKPLPEGWDLPPIADHFAHISTKNPMLIAFTADDEQGILDRVTPIRPGAYLTRFYPDLAEPFDLAVFTERLKGRDPTPGDIEAEHRRLGENARKRYAGLIDKGLDINLATTPDEIEWVYENASEAAGSGSLVSCATRAYQKRSYHHDGGDFHSTVHPTRVYGAGDLAVAYTVGKSGNVAERCVVWPEKRLHGPVYSDGSGRLKKLLEVAEYKHSPEGYVGARLLRILEVYKGDEYFVMPHIDTNMTSPYQAQGFRDDGEYLIIDNVGGTMRSNTTRGLVKAVLKQEMKEAA